MRRVQLLVAILTLFACSALGQMYGITITGGGFIQTEPPLSIAFFHDAGDTTDTDVQAMIDLVVAHRVSRGFRGIHHSGDYPGSGATTDPLRAAFLTKMKAIPATLGWGLNFAHFDGDQNHFGRCGEYAGGGSGPEAEYTCDSGGFTTDLGGTGVNYQWGSTDFYKSWAAESAKCADLRDGPDACPGTMTADQTTGGPDGHCDLLSVGSCQAVEDRSDTDIFWHAHIYDWGSKGVVVLSMPWTANNEAAFDAAMDDIEATYPGWPVILNSHEILADGGIPGSPGGTPATDPFDRNDPDRCVFTPQFVDTSYMYDRDSVFMMQSSHCPTTPGCVRGVAKTSSGYDVIGCVADWWSHKNTYGDAGDFFAVEIYCETDTVIVRTLDAVDNETVGAGCSYPPGADEEVDVNGEACCDYTTPYGPNDPGCTEVWTFTNMGLDDRGMC